MDLRAQCKYARPSCLSGVIRRDVAARPVFPACVADHYESLGDPGSAGDGVSLRHVDSFYGPLKSARLLVKSDQAAVQRTQIHLPTVESDAAIHHIAAEKISALARHLGIVGPLQLARLRVDGEHHAPGACRVDDAVFDKRCPFQAERSAELAAPGESQLGDGLLVDLV